MNRFTLLSLLVLTITGCAKKEYYELSTRTTNASGETSVKRGWVDEQMFIVESAEQTRRDKIKADAENNRALLDALASGRLTGSDYAVVTMAEALIARDKQTETSGIDYLQTKDNNDHRSRDKLTDRVFGSLTTLGLAGIGFATYDRGKDSEDHRTDAWKDIASQPNVVSGGAAVVGDGSSNSQPIDNSVTDNSDNSIDDSESGAGDDNSSPIIGVETQPEAELPTTEPEVVTGTEVQ